MLNVFDLFDHHQSDQSHHHSDDDRTDRKRLASILTAFTLSFIFTLERVSVLRATIKLLEPQRPQALIKIA